ncbi:VOC family protein [Amycolatopsis sp. NPDC005961]|uniref:Glyoxalase/bleomycin resistance protein/dioxygenase n=1 Tax=Amycolatopsis camponoti TaxID=2606593 RepID=A0A6I8LRS5_9PSEU|nr:VOC family protein [Amycolatopsis camponoti]VVJ20614.1 Glyoxalase/bleomycin resistance protein/dioxygenase [Amycolatopsis camponoti]
MEVLKSRLIVRARDAEATTAFYRDTLGLAVEREFPGGTVFFLGHGSLEVSGRGETGASPDLVLWLQVRDLAGTLADLKERGLEPVRGAQREPWGLDEAWIADPEGTRIVLVEVPEGHPIRVDTR